MNEQAIAIFCICDEIVKSYRFSETPQYKMTTAEVMAFAIISALHDHADYRTTRLSVRLLHYFPSLLSHSHLIRRIHAIPEQMWYMVFYALKMYLHKSKNDCFSVDIHNIFQKLVFIFAGILAFKSGCIAPAFRQALLRRRLTPDINSRHRLC